MKASDKQRKAWPDAFELTGHMKVTQYPNGLLHTIGDLKLGRKKPLPPFTKYLDLEEQHAKYFLRHQHAPTKPPATFDVSDLTWQSTYGTSVKALRLKLGLLEWTRQHPTSHGPLIMGHVDAG